MSRQRYCDDPFRAPAPGAPRVPDRGWYGGREHGTIGDLRVLVVDTEGHGRQHTVQMLRKHGSDCHVVPDDDNTVHTAGELRPDAIVLDSCVLATSGVDLLRQLKADHRTALIPVICVAGDVRSNAVIELLAAGADDYVARPFRTVELLARILGAARRRALLGGVSPLTGLPGNVLLTRELESRLEDGGGEFAFLHIDVDHFKAFNDRYGYVRGDQVIAATARMLQAQVEDQGASAVLGHIGGDDFGIVTTTDAARPLADAVATAFDALSPGFYDEQERARRSVLTETREGAEVAVPLMSVSIGVALWTPGQARSATAVADVASEMKTVAKRHAGSHVAVDCRRA
jgi:diguanylate cyclase (GGDEF)-like protein